MDSLVIPVYRNAASLPDLLAAITTLARESPDPFEAVFVVDGSPDDSITILRAALPRLPFATQLVELSRNYGAFAAIREGLRHARGDCYAVMAADLQEPPALVGEFFAALRADRADVVVGTREGRADPWLDRVYSRTFWAVYRRLVQPEMPAGGIDVFGCNRAFRDHLLALESVATSLVGQIVWLGFRRLEIPYSRRARQHGKSAWSFRKKLDYLLDSVFAFTDFPIKALLFSGAFGVVLSVLMAIAVLIAKIEGTLDVPGYAATVLLILFFAGLNLFGLGIVGSYAYRAFAHARRRPAAVVMRHDTFPGQDTP